MTRTPQAVRFSIALLVSLAVWAAPRTASAALGGTAASVDADRIHAQGALLRIVRGETHAVHEIRAASGTTIREYVTPAGTVFAVAWEGPWLPDMRQVLGSHFDQYQRALQAASRRRGSRGTVTIDQPDLVVHMHGHQRSFSGRAYVPGLVPPGVQPNAIR